MLSIPIHYAISYKNSPKYLHIQKKKIDLDKTYCYDTAPWLPNFSAQICLEPDEIDFYTDGMAEIINEYRPNNREVGLIDVGCNTLFAGFNTSIHHSMMVVYVELVSPSTTDPVEPLPCSIC